jgi:hypothetical protein
VRLQAGILLAAIAAAAILCTLPAPWYNVYVVGPNFEEAMRVGEPPLDQEIRVLDGTWTVWDYELNNATFSAPLPEFTEPMSVYTFGEDEREVDPNANVNEVYATTSGLVVSGSLAFLAAAVGSYQVARNGRWRMFTAASMLLAGILMFAAPAYYGFELPGAMADDAARGDPLAFGAAYEPYIDSTAGPPPFYGDFEGGYDAPAGASEQLEYGPGVGWYLSGFAAVMSVLAGALLFGAPQWGSAKATPRPREIYRYVPIPIITGAPHVPRYPRRGASYGVNPASPGLSPEMRGTGIARTPAQVDRYPK